MHRVAQDVRIALRGFRHAPAFAATAVLILGVGIGMAVAMTTVFDAVLLRALPVREQDRIVVPRARDGGGVEVALVPPELEELRRESRTMRDIAGVDHSGARAFPLTDGDRSVVLAQAKVTGNFFVVLGSRPALGRLLRSEDDVRGAPPVLVISYGAWRRQFGGDSAVIGRQLTEPVFQAKYTIVGVAPPGLDYPIGVDYWIPAGTVGGAVATIVARLSPAATAEAARAEFFTLLQRTNRERAVPKNLVRADVRTFAQAVVGDIRPVLRVLTAAVALLLVIACVNVGTLLLLRGTTRAPELAVRRALGGSYRDIVRQLVIESVLLAVAGGALGLVCAEGLLRLLLAVAPAGLPRADAIGLGGAPVGLAVGITALAVLLFGVVPALIAARSNLASPLRFGARSGQGTRQQRRVREWFVASQVALALVMLAGAGLLARSLARLEQLKLGYTAEHLSILELAIPQARYAEASQFNALVDQLSVGLRAVPGVTALTPLLVPPFVGPNVYTWKFKIEGQSQLEGTANPTVAIETGGPDYFRTLGIRLQRGRGFVEDDRENAPPVAVVSEAVARRFFPGQDPIGKRIRFDIDSVQPRTIVGVADDIHFRSLREATPTVYLPWRQSLTQGYLAVRTSGDPTAVLPAMRRVMDELDLHVTLWRGRTMDELLAGPLAQPRLSTLLLSGFGLVALLLAALGLYGVMASVVRERTRELGVRMALGATPARVRRDVLGQALAVSVVGALIGVAVALVTSRLFEPLLFEVSPTDPGAVLGASGILLAVAMFAAYLPARRATRIDPALALRAE